MASHARIADTGTESVLPLADDVVAHARSFREELLKAGAQTEANRRVSGEMMVRLDRAGLTRLSRSRLYGGMAFGPSVLVRVGYELGQGCASTAWCTMLANCNSWFASYWSQQAQDDIWSNAPEIMLAGLGVPTGKCELAEGGFRVWGSWPWASNCENSQWAFVSAICPETNGRAAGVAWFLMPMRDLTIDQSSWFVSGMQGTGSKTLVAQTPVFVPAHRVIYFDDIATRRVPGCFIPLNSPANFAFSTFGGAALAGPVLGTAQGILNLFVASMKEKLRVSMKPGAPITAGQNPYLQERVGRAQAMIHSALHTLVVTLEKAEQEIFAGEELDVGARILVRRTIVHSVRQATDAANLVMELAGASAADSALPLQRFWRDINAASRHASFDAGNTFGMAGQQLLGLPPIGAY